MGHEIHKKRIGLMDPKPRNIVTTLDVIYVLKLVSSPKLWLKRTVVDFAKQLGSPVYGFGSIPIERSRFIWAPDWLPDSLQTSRCWWLMNCTNYSFPISSGLNNFDLWTSSQWALWMEGTYLKCWCLLVCPTGFITIISSRGFELVTISWHK